MGIFSGLFKSRDKPVNRTAGSNYAFFFGGTTSGKAVTERSAMQMTAEYYYVRNLTEAEAGLPIHEYRNPDNGSKEKKGIVPIIRRVTINGTVSQFSCNVTSRKNFGC